MTCSTSRTCPKKFIILMLYLFLNYSKFYEMLISFFVNKKDIWERQNGLYIICPNVILDDKWTWVKFIFKNNLRGERVYFTCIHIKRPTSWRKKLIKLKIKSTSIIN